MGRPVGHRVFLQLEDTTGGSVLHVAPIFDAVIAYWRFVGYYFVEDFSLIWWHIFKAFSLTLLQDSRLIFQ